MGSRIKIKIMQKNRLQEPRKDSSRQVKNRVEQKNITFVWMFITVLVKGLVQMCHQEEKKVQELSSYKIDQVTGVGI